MTESNDPTAIRTVVVTATDLVTALESNYRTADDDTVLRATPPFSGRMRARLHVQQGSPGGEPEPICLRAESLVEDSWPPPPKPDDVEDALRADPAETYTVDRHRDRYRAALREWRASVPDYVVEEVDVPPAGGQVTISLLGTVHEE